nr:reverse transcriptase domain-containing protein [Tanacetum cinerariifolium]
MLLDFDDFQDDIDEEIKVNKKGKAKVGDEDLSKPFKEVLKCPFTRRIVELSSPGHRMPANAKIYDGTRDPEHHTLDDKARTWFDKLSPGKRSTGTVGAAERPTPMVTLRKQEHHAPYIPSQRPNQEVHRPREKIAVLTLDSLVKDVRQRGKMRTAEQQSAERQGDKHEAEVKGYLVRRIHVDEWASVEIMFKHCFNMLHPSIKARSILSTIPGMMKFPTPRGIETLVSQMPAIFECVRVGKKKAIELPEEVEPQEKASLTKQMLVNTTYPEQLKVAELLKAGIVRPVKYPTWISNPILVKKANRNWRMCIDFKNINVACPKDYYLLPEIDIKIEVIIGFPFKCFLDGYKGYHQVQMAEEDEEKKSSTHIKSPRTWGEMQRLAGKLATLNRFLSQSADRSLPFYETLRTSPKKIKMIIDGQKTPFNNLKNDPVPTGSYNSTSEGNLVYIPSDIGGSMGSDSMVSRHTSYTVDNQKDCKEEWVLYTDDSSSIKGFSACLVLISPMKTEYTYALRLNFESTNNQVEYEAILARPIASQLRPTRNTYGGMQHAFESKWGMDVLGPLLEALGKVKFVIVAIDYFTKRIEAKPLTKMTGKEVKKFIWDNIACRVGLPRIIVMENGANFIHDLSKAGVKN